MQDDANTLFTIFRNDYLQYSTRVLYTIKVIIIYIKIYDTAMPYAQFNFQSNAQYRIYSIRCILLKSNEI